MSSFIEQKTTEASFILMKLNEEEISINRLIQLLYIADRMALQEWERPITYARYRVVETRSSHKSTLSLSFDRTTDFENWLQNIRPSANQIEIRKISHAEIELLRWVNWSYGKSSDSELTNIIGCYPEFKNKRETTSLTSLEEILKAIGYDTLEIERVISQIQEEADIQAIFN